MKSSSWVVVVVLAALNLGCGGTEQVTVTSPPGGSLRITTDLGVGYVLQTTIPQPVVQVMDANGDPFEKAGIEVTATIPAGDVKVVSGGAVTTNGRGEARFSELAFGAKSGNAGDFEVRYISPGLAPASEHEAITCRLGTLNMGSEVAGDLKDGDCLADGARYRYYDEGPSAHLRTSVRVTQTSQAFAPAVFVRKRHDVDEGFIGVLADAPGALSFKLLAAINQDVRFMAASAAADVFGAFQLGFASVPQDEPDCEFVFMMTPVNSTQTLHAGCADDQGNIGDFFPFLFRGQVVITATVTSAAFTPYVAIWSLQPKQRVAYNEGTGNSASVSFTNAATVGSLYYVFVGSTTGSGVGPYTLQVSESFPSVHRPVASLTRRGRPHATRLSELAPSRLSGGPRLTGAP